MMLDNFKKYLKTKCWFFFHNWKDTDRPVENLVASEKWYWKAQKCIKCGRERDVLK